jgi:predicted DNA-binding transcriptional regulator YafY
MPPKQAAMYMRALKLLDLLERLERGRTMTMEQLAADIGVSRRTVFRLMPYVRGLQRQRQAHVCAPNTA